MNKLLLFAAMALSLALPAHAQQKAPDAQKPAADGKVDLSDLENKYWAPKDTDFSVVQNRTYTKAGRFFLTPQYGLLVNDSYSTGSVFGLTGNYFFSERYGVQLAYQKANLKNNNATNALASFGNTGVFPDHNQLNSFYGAGFSFVPFYAKMSLLGKRVLYFDMAITPVIGMTQYTQDIVTGNANKSAFTYGVDITQYYFINNWFAIRADLNNHWANENVVKYSVGNGLNPGDSVRTNNNLDTTFLLGLTFYY